ncbi:hypothetical protein [Brevundimonas sp.]|uniref:hypothetical protein n=1 Tax=Brevundimonas sp. TaxID=1871086 RepID=UPI0028990F54|nr:hypothetical protein [Brevundimonas sp.]
MNMPTLPGVAPAARRGPGRPKGSTNKRSGDLQRYVEAQFNGLTPGQQSAQIALVTAKELRACNGDLLSAMALKAKELARLLGCEAKEAWLLMQRERADLLPYIHQKRAPKAEEDGDQEKAPHVIIGVPMEAGTAAGSGEIPGEWDTPQDLLDYQPVSDDEPEQVTQPKSHAQG